jgi:hypothetical protein
MEDLVSKRITEKTAALKTQAYALKSQADTLIQDLAQRAESLQFQAARDISITGGTLKLGAVTRACDIGTAALEGATRRLEGKEGAETATEKLRDWTRSLSEAKSTVRELSIESYDTLNVREVNAALPGLSSWQVEQVRRFEADHKNRVTVMRACAQQLKLAA